MNIYVICPVRCATAAESEMVSAHVAKLEAAGHVVHYPPRDVDQDDTTGARICDEHRDAMEAADAIHVFWNPDSKGSHFDFGMAYALRKPVEFCCLLGVDGEGKSYWKVLWGLLGTRPTATA